MIQDAPPLSLAAIVQSVYLNVGVSPMMNVDAVAGRLPLVLLVDPVVATRHTLWRALHRAFGVLEADSVASARTWMARRPDIDAIVVHDDLPDGSGLQLARDLVELHPVAKRAIVLGGTFDVNPAALDGLTHVEPDDLRGIVTRLASWLSARDVRLAQRLLRDAEQLIA